MLKGLFTPSRKNNRKLKKIEIHLKKIKNDNKNNKRQSTQ